MDKNNKPSITVIVPVYNAEKTLERAIESLLNQSFQDFEVLFAFDGGDASLEILEKYKKEHSNFSIRYHEQRLGPGKGRLDAIKYAKGDYLAFLDSDDCFVPSALETLYMEAQKENADVVNGSFLILEKEGKKPIKNPFVKKCVLTDENQILGAFFEDSYFRSFLFTKLLKRSLIADNSFLSFNEKGDLFEDKALLGSILTKAKRVVSIREAICVYDKTSPSSMTSSPRKDRHSRSIDVYNALKNYYLYQKDAIALKTFYRYALRTKLSLSFDLSRDKRNGASKEYLRSEKEKEKSLFDKKGTMDASSLQKRLMCLEDID